MGYSIYKQDSNISYNLKKFIADTPSDLSTIPTTCAAGSTIFIISTSTKYMLNTRGEWVPLSTGGGGGVAAGIKTIYLNAEGHLIFELTDGTLIDAGEMPVPKIDVINCGDSSGVELSLLENINNIK